jgi:Protein of unknown function (DUF3311)
MLQRRPGSEHRCNDRSPWHLLLIIPIVAPLLIPMINRTKPTLLGIPFFYWSQLAFVTATMVITLAVHHLTKRRR